jgi:hypothetical protein
LPRLSAGSSSAGSFSTGPPGEIDVYTAPQLRERVIQLLANRTRHSKSCRLPGHPASSSPATNCDGRVQNVPICEATDPPKLAPPTAQIVSYL